MIDTTTQFAEFTEIISRVDVPVQTGLAAQGDLIFIPWDEETAPAERAAAIANTRPLTTGRVTVVHGNGGNCHDLIASPGVAWYKYPGDRQTVGVINVDSSSTALLDHPEHGAVILGTGAWIVRRQREQADQINMVAD